jgi:hypothetical protein
VHSAQDVKNYLLEISSRVSACFVEESVQVDHVAVLYSKKSGL